MNELSESGRSRYFARVPKAFNEWMRRYTEEPERFQHEMRTVRNFLRDQTEGKEPGYGDECAAYLDQILGELTTSA